MYNRTKILHSIKRIRNLLALNFIRFYQVLFPLDRGIRRTGKRRKMGTTLVNLVEDDTRETTEHCILWK